MHVDEYLNLLRTTELLLGDHLEQLARRHERDPALRDLARRLAGWSHSKARALAPFIDDPGDDASDPDVDRLAGALFRPARSGGVGLVRDLHDVAMLAEQAVLGWAVVARTAQVLRNPELAALAGRELARTEEQQAALRDHLRLRAPGLLTAPSEETAARPTRRPLAVALQRAAPQPLRLPARLLR